MSLKTRNLSWAWIIPRMRAYNRHPMDTFTLSVVIGDIAMIAIILTLVVMDMRAKSAPATEPPKQYGKRPA